MHHTCVRTFFSVFSFGRKTERERERGRRTKKKNPKAIPSVCLHIRRESYQFQNKQRESKAHSDTISNSKTLHAYGSSGCVGCYKRSTVTTTVDVPSKGLTKQGEAVKKPSTSEDFWTTSTHDMDNSAVQSQGSMSSTSLTNQAVLPHGSSSKSSNPTEFVNHGLILWNQTRQRWVGNKKPDNQTQQLREPKLSWNATYESLLGSSKPFRQPIPLAEMVDFLVDIWEQDGLYD